MNKKFYFFVFFLVFTQWSFSQSILGNWFSFDKKNEKECIIEVFKENNKFYAKIKKLLQKDDHGKKCNNCPGEKNNQPIEGLVILEDLNEDGDIYSGGKILDPKNGKYYQCYVSLENENKLKIRAYYGLSLFGRTEYLQRAPN